MEKEHPLTEPNNESQIDLSQSGKLNEPAMAYSIQKSISLHEFTNEEKLQRIDQAIKDEEAGIYFTHEEIINKYKNKR